MNSVEFEFSLLDGRIVFVEASGDVLSSEASAPTEVANLSLVVFPEVDGAEVLTDKELPADWVRITRAAVDRLIEANAPVGHA